MTTELRPETPSTCRHGKPLTVHCKRCQIAGYCACKECERDSN